MIQTTRGFLKRLPTPTVTTRATSTPYKEVCPLCSVLMDLRYLHGTPSWFRAL